MKQLFNVESEGIRFSTGSLAKQANGAVVVTLGETSVFVSAVAAKKCLPEQNFFPLTVDYRERFSAAGKFPGGYAKREGKPSEKEVLTSRLCDRPLRPLFPKGFMNEVQVIGLLLAADGKNEGDILMVNGASAALACSDIPWAGPIGCVRVGEIDGEFVANPTNEAMFRSRLDLIYVGNEKDMMMIEGNADQLAEDRFIEALAFAHQQIQPLIEAQKELARLCGKPKKIFTLHTVPENIMEICTEYKGRLAEAVFQAEKVKREEDVEAVKTEAKEAVLAVVGEETYEEFLVNMAFEELQEELYRKNILDYGKRVDDRAIDEIRPLHCETNILPRVHGTALFQRGETQALVSVTLGSSRDVQELDAITGGIKTKTFLLHYNFPPYCVGETGRTTGAGRREIGHGALAERSLSPIIPSEEVFPYSIRIVSDILESNGSSSMASVCGGCLALMDAGVPILAPVSGISTGLVTEFDAEGNLKKYVVLTDILGDEDHFGDMDFKICGTAQGITGFQLDLKIKGLPLEIAKEAIYRNREARSRILETMLAVQPCVSEHLKPSAPGFKEVWIDPDKIGALIGPGGKNIKRLTESSGAQIDIDEDNSGRVMIFAPNQESLDQVLVEINAMNAEIEVGKTYKGMVKSIKDFGVFVECLPGKEGMVHVSELAEFRVENVEDICKPNDEIIVKCVGVDEKGRVRLSRRAVLCEAKGEIYVSSRPVSSGVGRRPPRSMGGNKSRYGS
ncbi:MAG: polyribonucleotide nucleotidyltransferase [Puniceicoccales bacterium]|jgi:polyribonucleotide nucleotidyltransferase|nr:polyribonucleotide nucleotidyltransferase [Puniceicoccales bacterium]